MALPANAVAFAYKVEIDAPPALQPMLRDNFELVRFETNARMDEPQLRRLLDRAPDAVRRLMESEGYYAPAVDASLSQGAEGWQVRLKVDPGKRVNVGKVEIAFKGAILRATAFA